MYRRSSGLNQLNCYVTCYVNVIRLRPRLLSFCVHNSWFSFCVFLFSCYIDMI